MNVSHTPSSISLTVVARNWPAPNWPALNCPSLACSRRASRSSIWPRPRLAVPPQGAGHLAAEHAVVGRHEVGVERVRHAEFARRAHARILEPGDAQRVQVGLAREQAREKLGLRRRRHAGGDQAHGPVVQRARRLAGFVPLDPAVYRVGGARVDARELQGRRVHPGAVVIPVRQEGGPAAGDGVQVRRRRQAAGEGLHGPARRRAPRRRDAGPNCTRPRCPGIRAWSAGRAGCSAGSPGRR